MHGAGKGNRLQHLRILHGDQHHLRLAVAHAAAQPPHRTFFDGTRRWHAQQALRQQTHPQLLVAHRYITRPASAGSENHIALSEPEFFTRAGQQLFALSWHANGY